MFEVSGLIISALFASFNFILLVVLSLVIHLHAKNSGESLKFSKFCDRLSKMRGVFVPLIVHIYDTATDIGVLYEWYQLTQLEKNDPDIKIESLNMQLFFDTALYSMIVYRAFLGIAGGILCCIFSCGFTANETGYSRHRTWPCFICLGFVIGIILGVLELGIFIAVFIEQKTTIQDQKQAKEKLPHFMRNDPKTMKRINKIFGGIPIRAGPIQKGIQLIEGVLESLPELILQSVFIIHSANDPYLSKSEQNNNSLFLLVILSIIASLISITNKYIWFDEIMVIKNVKSFYVTDELMLTQLIENELNEKGCAELFSWLYNSDDPCAQHIKPTSKSELDDERRQILPYLLSQLVISHCNSIDIQMALGLMDMVLGYTESAPASTNFSFDYYDVTTIDLLEAKQKAKKHAWDWTLDKIESTDQRLQWAIDNIDRTCISKEKTAQLVKIASDYQYSWVIPACQESMCCFCVATKKHKYFISYGFIFRVIWRFSAVVSRFVIFSLIWTIFNQNLVIIFIVCMIALWYVLLILLVIGKSLAVCCISFPQSEKKVNITDRCDMCCDKCCTACFSTLECMICNCGCGGCNAIGRCIVVWLICIWCLLSFGVIGLVCQLGLIVISGKWMYMVRLTENIVLMGIVTGLAFANDLECTVCVDGDKRNPMKNTIIFGYIIAGWTSVAVYATTMKLVSKMIGKHWKGCNFDTVVT